MHDPGQLGPTAIRRARYLFDMAIPDVHSHPRDHVLLVDDQDRPLRPADKAASHRGRGQRHRAFTLLVFDRDARLLLAQRAATKTLWSGSWDGTVASHPRVDESYVDAARRRLPDEVELAADADLDIAVLNRFLYRADDESRGAENEVCATVITVLDADSVRGSRPDEISALRWSTPTELLGQAKEDPDDLCPWLLIALEFVARRRWTPPASPMTAIVEQWARALDAETLARAVAAHHVDAHYATLDD